MPRSGFFISGVSGFAGLVVLVLAGLFLLFLLAAYALAAAAVAIVPVSYLDAKREWNGAGEHFGYVLILPLAFFVSGAFAFALDAVLGTHVSVPGMIAALDLVVWQRARPGPLVPERARLLRRGPGTHAVDVAALSRAPRRDRRRLRRRAALDRPRGGSRARGAAAAEPSDVGLERGGRRDFDGRHVPDPGPGPTLAARARRLSVPGRPKREPRARFRREGSPASAPRNRDRPLAAERGPGGSSSPQIARKLRRRRRLV